MLSDYRRPNGTELQKSWYLGIASILSVIAAGPKKGNGSMRREGRWRRVSLKSQDKTASQSSALVNV